MVPVAPTPCPKAMLPATTAKTLKRQIRLNDIRPPPKVAYCPAVSGYAPTFRPFKWCRYTKAEKRGPPDSQATQKCAQRIRARKYRGQHTDVKGKEISQ